MTEKLNGVVERITFHNTENGFCILRIQARGHRGVVTVKGTMVNPVVGEYIDAEGEWIIDREYGRQFQAASLQTTPPYTEEGIVKYLGSGLIKGIGPKYAKKIVDVFGPRTLQIIDESPGYLSEIKGIGPERVRKIRESWQAQKAVREIMVFLQSYGLGTARAVRIYKKYGDQACDLVRQNPYRLASDIWGIGFDSADQLARHLKIDAKSPLRAAAALRYKLQMLTYEKGHCAFPEKDLLAGTDAMLNKEDVHPDEIIPRETLVAALEELRNNAEVVREPFDNWQSQEPWIYLKPLFMAEIGVANALKALRFGIHPLPEIDTEATLFKVEQSMKLRLAESQKEAIRQATTSKVLIVTGGPGVGKTTIVRGILETFLSQGLRCTLCAPTGRAAKRMTETTGCEAKTIHRLIEYDPSATDDAYRYKKNRTHKLELDLLIVDEVSMVDVILMNRLLAAVPDEASVVFVGDVDQLPPVGPGSCLREIIDSETVPVVRLTEIFRQAGESAIIRAAHSVNRGEMPVPGTPENPSDFYFVEADKPDAVTNAIITMVRARVPSKFGLDPVNDVQILTPVNKTELGAINLNARLQEVLNPSGKKEVQRLGITYRLGDKVIQTENDYNKEVFNGDIGRIVGIDMIEQEVKVSFDGREVPYDFSDLDKLALAYALTIHKSQGSEYPAVIIPVHNQHYMMLHRNLLYTGMTRGKRLVVLVGQRKALNHAIRNLETAHRYTALAWQLQKRIEGALEE